MKSRQVLLLTGKTGSGKSVMFRSRIKDEARFIIFDSVKEYADPASPFPALFVQDFKTLIDYLSANKNKPFRIVFDPTKPFEGVALKTGENISSLELLCKIVYDCLQDVTLGIEELGKHPTQKELSPNLSTITCLGRHKGISLFATTQRAAQIHTDFKAQITKFIAFRQHLPNDLEWIGDCIGDPKEAESLRTLEKFIWGKPMVPGKHFKEYDL